MPNSFNEGAYKQIYQHPKWREEAGKYEVNFAANLYKDSLVQSASRNALTKLSRMLNAYYRDDRSLQISRTVAEDATAVMSAANLISNGNEDTSQILPEAGTPTQPAESTATLPAESTTQPAESTTTPPAEITPTLQQALLPDMSRDSFADAGQVGNAYRGIYQSIQNAGQREAEGSTTVITQDDWNAATQTNAQNLDTIINGDGNLREQMTLLYNGMFLNGGKNKGQIAQSRSLKNMMAYISQEDIDRSPELAGVRLELLQEMTQRKKRSDVFDTRHISYDLVKIEDEKNGRGNAFSRFFAGIGRMFNATFSSKVTRYNRRKSKIKGLGLSHYEDLGLNLSERERKNGLNENGDLRWKEGTALYGMWRPVKANGMLQTAGPSGTTLRMLAAYKLMGASTAELLDFRLALMAWMVTSKDHSIYEILVGSHNAGVVGEEDLSEPAKMYTTIDPLPVDVIRERFAPNKEFPHETVYKIMLNEFRDRRLENGKNSALYRSLLVDLAKVRADMAPIKAEADNRWQQLGSEQTQALHDEIYRNLDILRNEEKKLLQYMQACARSATMYSLELSRSKKGPDAMNLDAQDVALNVYTTGAYLAMNRGRKYGNLVGWWALRGNKTFENATDKEKQNLGILGSAYNLSRISSRMAQDALQERAINEEGTEAQNHGRAAYTGKTYRGGKITDNLTSKGDVITTKALTSTSQDIQVAQKFYWDERGDRNNGENFILLEYELTGKGGIDISSLSRLQSEKEVLLPENTRFEVVDVKQKRPATEKEIRWEEDATNAKENARKEYYVARLRELDSPTSRKKSQNSELAALRRGKRDQYRQSAS